MSCRMAISSSSNLTCPSNRPHPAKTARFQRFHTTERCIAPFLNAGKVAVSAAYRAVCDTDSVRIVCLLGDSGGQRLQRFRDHARTRLGCSPEHREGDEHGYTQTPHQGGGQHHPRQGRHMEVPQGPRRRPVAGQTTLLDVDSELGRFTYQLFRRGPFRLFDHRSGR